MDEWKSMGHKDDENSDREARSLSLRKNAEDRRVLGRSRSATNIMIKGFQYYSRSNSVCRSNSMCRSTNSMCPSNSSLTRDMSEDRMTDRDFDEVNHYALCVWLHILFIFQMITGF